MTVLTALCVSLAPRLYIMVLCVRVCVCVVLPSPTRFQGGLPGRGNIAVTHFKHKQQMSWRPSREAELEQGTPTRNPHVRSFHVSLFNTHALTNSRLVSSILVIAHVHTHTRSD